MRLNSFPRGFTQKMVILLLLLICFSLTTGCGTKSKNNNLTISNHVEFGVNDYNQITPANNELGFQLLKAVEPDENGNIFISPTSLLMALSMVYNGADGVTKEEIAKTLQLEGITVDALNKANASLLSMLGKNSEGVQLHVANSIWLNEDFHFQDAFTNQAEDYFNAEIKEIDVSNSNSPKRINDWVKKQTNKKIEEIADDPLDPNLVAMLINAIYFNGNWTYEFDKQQTEERTFYQTDGTTTEVPLMLLEEELAYLETEKFQAVTLPYGDEKMSMHIFLPKEDSSLVVFKETLTSENWQAWRAGFHKQNGTVLLPRFQLGYEILLNEALEKLGMSKAFTEDAEFTRMIEEDDPLWISLVKQKTFIDVNEKGTEAAAVTSVDMKTTSAPIDGPFHMEINRPFFFTITDDELDVILFMGMISKPQEGE